MAISVKRNTEIRVSGQELRPLVLMAQIVLEIIISGGEHGLEPEDKHDVRKIAEFLISVGCDHEEV